MHDRHPYAITPLRATLRGNEPGVTKWYPGMPISINIELDEKRDLAERRSFKHNSLLMLEHNKMIFLVLMKAKVNPRWFLSHVEDGTITELEQPAIRYSSKGCSTKLGRYQMKAITKGFDADHQPHEWFFNLFRPRLLPGTLCQHDRADIFYIRAA